MAEVKFQIGAKVSTPGDDPTLRILVDRAAPIPTGVYRFSLVAVDDAGNESIPSEALVTIFDDKQPVARLSVIPGPTVGFGDPFVLSAKGSFDVGGTIKEYRWTIVDVVG